jgi:hypothetical protein
MSLVYCPECGHEISRNAIACPNCGLPLSARPPVVEEVVRPVEPSSTVITSTRRTGLPPWAIPVFAVVGLLLVVILFLIFRGSSDDANVNVALSANRRALEANREARTTTVPQSETSTQTVPGSQVSVPVSSAPVASEPSTQTVPGTTTAAPQPVPDRGTVSIRAKVVTSRGSQQPARGAKFYLLDKDVESILSEARVEPIEGNSMTASLGLAAVHPEQYGEFQRAAMRAIAAHAKYSGTTSSDGSARLANIAPKDYYLFAITRVGNGFAIWDSPVSVNPGDNLLDLSPATVTDVES